MVKPTLLFEAGTYGEFTLKILNHVEILPQEHYKQHNLNYIYTTPKRPDHHLIDEDAVTSNIIKITFENSDTDLINRNKWTKVKSQLKELSEKSFPNNPNQELFTMAIGKCNLLNAQNFFKTIKKKSTVEIKFKNFIYKTTTFVENFLEVCDKFKIPVTKKTLVDSHHAFIKGQEQIFTAHEKKNDIIAEANLFGEKYFQKHGLNYNKLHFDEMHNTLGGNNGKEKE